MTKLALAFVSLAVTPSLAQQLPNTQRLISVDTGSYTKAVMACVASYVDQGASVNDALDACSSIGFPALPPTANDLSGLADAQQNPNIAPAACAGIGADPRVSAGALTEPKDSAEAKRKIEELFLEAAEVVKAVNELKEDCDGGHGKPQACLALSYEETELNRIVGEVRYYEQFTHSANEYDHGDTDHGLVGNDLAYNACLAANQFVGECNRDGWSSTACQMFLDKGQGCADPLIANVDPDQGEMCQLEAVDFEEYKDVYFLVCSLDTLPGPDGTPCVPMTTTGLGHSYRLPGDPSDPLCSDTRALVDAEDCIHTMDLIEVGPSWQEELKTLGEKFGGPVVVLPQTGGIGCPACEGQ